MPSQPDALIFRRTQAHAGRHISISPANSATRHLSYGRIRLGPSRPSIEFGNQNEETGFIVVSGEVTITTCGRQFSLGRFDALYVPRGSHIQMTASSPAADVAEFSAPVAAAYPLQVVRYAEILRDPGLHFTAGGPACSRELHMLLGKNIQAGRLVAGFTFSEPGNWTSWPPHEHAGLLEEIYVYFDMPPPAFAVQMVYTDPETPLAAAIVRDGDAVVMPSGYHPNVACPGHRVGFIWAMAAHEELIGRQFGVVNIQSGFETGGSGLESGRNPAPSVR